MTADDHDQQTASPFTVAHDKMLKDIHTALVGKPELGVPGLVARVAGGEAATAALKEKVEGHERKIWLVSTVAGGLWATLVAFKDSFFGHK